MGDKVTLTVEKRTATGKQVAKIRSEGQVPAVVYGSAIKPQNVQMLQNEARRVTRDAGRHTPIEMTIDGKKQTALIKSVDYAPARRDITHLSFQAVRADEVVTTEVPLEFIGMEESEAAKAGLIILPTLESVEVRAKTADLPSEIVVDASQLSESEEKLTMLDAQIPDGVEVIDFDPEQVIATVWEPAALEAKNAAADKAADEARAAEAAGTDTAENVPSEQGDKTEETKE